MFRSPSALKKRRVRIASVTRFPCVQAFHPSRLDERCSDFRSRVPISPSRDLHIPPLGCLFFDLFSEIFRGEVDKAQPCLGFFFDRYHGRCNNWNPRRNGVVQKKSVCCAPHGGENKHRGSPSLAAAECRVRDSSCCSIRSMPRLFESCSPSVSGAFCLPDGRIPGTQGAFYVFPAHCLSI